MKKKVDRIDYQEKRNEKLAKKIKQNKIMKREIKNEFKEVNNKYRISW